MAEFLFHETIISAPSGQATLRVYTDDITGAPLRAEMQNTTPAPYAFYIGLTNRTVGQSESLTDTQKNVVILTGVAALINVLDVLSTNWMCGLEGG